MQCPQCHRYNRDGDLRCDCGYDLKSVVASAADTPVDVRSITAGYRANAILGQRWGALIVDLFVFIVVFVVVGVSIGEEKSDWPFFVALGFVLAYFIVLEGRWGVTLGKLAAKVRVVTADGKPPGYWRAAVRMLLRLIEVNPILLGGLPAGIVVALSPHRQRLGDMLAGTYVLNAPDVARIGKR